ncbi:MAG: hypothetical protein GX977_00820 [Firmicutes bacterium]|nr:hypothetical protein [Bacillota bacterium]
MARRVNVSIQVTCQGERPIAFFWEEQCHTITQIIESWRESGEWWEKAPEITVYQVLTATQGLYELHHQATGQWLLYKIYD